MVVSVIIPTYNRSQFIELTLQSFVRQNFDVQQFEIIIADNNSTDSTKDVINRFIENNKNVSLTYFIEKNQGVHYARNSAAKKARGEYLYFTDDDMIAEPDLLKELLYLFTLDSKIASVTGVVRPKWEVKPPDWVLKLCNNALLSLNDPDYDLIISDKDCNVFSCHQMIKREVFFSSGGFNPENTKGLWIGDGETGLNMKIKELGFKFAFNRKSVIHHIIPAGRMTQSYLNKRLANQGNSDCYTFYRKNHPGSLVLMIRMVKSSIKSCYSLLRCLKNILFFNINWRLNLARFYYHVSGIKYLAKLIRDPEWRALVLKKDWLND